MLTLFAYVLLIKGVFSLIVFMPTEINVTLKSDSSIVLNCTYTLGVNEIFDVLIIKKKTSSGHYIELAKFTDRYTVYTQDGEYLKNRSKLYGFNTSSSSAVLAINKVRCEDDGQYQCYVDYIGKDTGLKSIQNTTVYINALAEEPTFQLPSNNITKEHDVVNLTCSANVGNPQGLLELWRQNKTSEIYELLGNTSVVYRDIENCTSIANLTVTYNFTRQDNGAMFRCSSRNKNTNNQIPAVHIGPVNVLYAPFNTSIEPSRTNYYVEENADLKCNSDGNPSPNYTWMFNFTEIVNSSKYSISGDKSKLSFTLHITDNGYYQCVASNKFGGDVFNVMLTVQEKNVEPSSSDIKSTCSRTSCLFIQSCTLRNGSSICSLNIWSVIAFVFIALTVISGAACVSLILSSKPRKKINQTNGIGDVHISYTREKFEDFGGYADPKDVKRPENGPIKLDNPYADPVDFQTQYAVVQKTWETPAKSSKDANSSDTSNLLNNTDSSNTENPSTSETANTKNSTNDEKTPGSTETSETIPKPPNVYDGAWV